MLKIANPRSQAFIDHWCALPRREGVLIPHSTGYLDQAPTSLMPAMFIQEVTNEGLMVRFMGTELVSRWRRDDTGKVFGANLSAADRARTVRAGQIVTDHPCGMLQHAVMQTSVGRAAIFEAILLPLAVDHHRPKRMVVFSMMRDPLESDEYGKQFSAPGEREWLDVGAGLPTILSSSI